MKTVLKVKGMHCHACEVVLKEVVEESGGKNVSASTPKGEVIAEFASANELEKAKNAIRSEGYRV